MDKRKEDSFRKAGVIVHNKCILTWIKTITRHSGRVLCNFEWLEAKPYLTEWQIRRGKQGDPGPEGLINHDQESGLYCIEEDRQGTKRRIARLGLHFRKIALATVPRVGWTEKESGMLSLRPFWRYTGSHLLHSPQQPLQRHVQAAGPGAQEGRNCHS